MIIMPYLSGTSSELAKRRIVRQAGRFTHTRTSEWARSLPLLVGVLALAGVSQSVAAAEGAAPIAAKVLSVRKIWDRAPHNAFTDLLRFGDAWYCAFREGRAHVSEDGKIRILRSTDGREWESAGLLSLADFDLRDAGLSQTPDGRLMVVGGATALKPQRGATGSFVSFSSDGASWSDPKMVVAPGDWLWKVTWHDGTAYGVAYKTGAGSGPSRLMTSTDGVAYRELVAKLLDAGGWATEATVRFGLDGEGLIVHRRDNTPNSGFLGRAKPPYESWNWQDLGVQVGGPNFIQTPAGDWVVACRLYDGRQRTSLAWLDVERGAIVELASLPSGGDTSYPGLVWHDGRLWVSYYSSHEERTSIYLAEVEIAPASGSESP